MGAGSLMTPILISVFGIPATTAVGTDLIYASITKTFGAVRHRQLDNVNIELAKWFAFGSVPAALAGTFALYNLFGDNVSSWLPDLIGYMLVLVGVAVLIRTFVSIRGLLDASKLPTDAPLNRNHKIMALVIGVVFGFLLGLTSVGSGVFFGMAMVTVFPLSTRKVVGTDIFHGAMVTLAAAAGHDPLGPPRLLGRGSDSDRVDPGDPDRLALHRPHEPAGTAKLNRDRAGRVGVEAARRLVGTERPRITADAIGPKRIRDRGGAADRLRRLLSPG